MPNFSSSMGDFFRYLILIFSSTFIGGVVSSITSILALFLMGDLLLGWRWLGLIGALVGLLMGFCSVMREIGVGSFMTNQRVLGATLYTYRDKVIEDNWFDYIYFFSAFALFVVYLWAFNPVMESDTFLTDITCLALALVGVAAIYISIRVLSIKII